MKLVDFLMIAAVLVVTYLIVRQPDEVILQNKKIEMEIDSLKQMIRALKDSSRTIDTLIIRNNYHYIKEVKQLDTVKTFSDVNALYRAILHELRSGQLTTTNQRTDN